MRQQNPSPSPGTRNYKLSKQPELLPDWQKYTHISPSHYYMLYVRYEEICNTVLEEMSFGMLMGGRRTDKRWMPAYTINNFVQNGIIIIIIIKIIIIIMIMIMYEHKQHSLFEFSQFCPDVLMARRPSFSRVMMCFEK